MDLVERAEAGDRKAVQALLEQGVDPNVHGRVDTRTALIVAAVQHDKTLCNLLLSHPRINIDDVDGNGETCLMYAVREVGRVAVSVCRNEADDAALEVAVDIVRLLMKKGANRYVSSKKGITAMHLARVQENTPASPMIGKERNDIPHAQVACVVDHDWQAISSAVSRHPSFLEMQALLRYDPTNLAQEDVCGLALRGDLNGVRSLLQQGVSPNAICRLNPYGKKNGSTVTCDSYYTPLIGACSGGHITVVQFLLDEENIRTDLQNPAGQSALFFATISESRQSEDIVVALLKAGASRYIKDRQENTPWMWGERRIAALQKMTLDKSRDHKYRLRNSRNIQHILRLDPALQTIQSVAAAADLFGVIALVRQGVDVNNCKPDISVEIEGLEESSHISVGETALIAAVRQSAPVREEKASRLTFSLLTSEPKSKRNLIAEDALKMIKLLLENQYTKVDLIDSSSRSALMHAVEVCSEQAVIILLGAGADRYWSNEACGTALDRALALGYNGIGKILATDPSRTSLTEAAISGDTETMDALRKQGVDPNQGGPLIAAAKSNQQEAVQFLLGMNGILVNKQNRLGETALMHAAGAGSMDVCYDLLRAGADGTIRDNLRMSSVDWAVRHGITTKLRLSVAMMTHGK
uniref:Uncharacterized protein n=1 Tax=Octactis speculum TaxID=3111310 RepID=A0A7S2FV54_9STRA